MATPDTAAVRSAVIGPPSRNATGAPVSASLRITTAWIAGNPSALLAAKPATHFIPSRSSRPAGVGAAQVRGHGMRERARGARMDADLGRQLGIRDQRGQRPLGQRQALVEVRHGREDVGRVEVAERGAIG